MIAQRSALIERGAEVDCRDKPGGSDTAAYLSRSGHFRVEVSRVLVDHHANVNARQYTYSTPSRMHLSALSGDREPIT
jgi:hypothetical protein